MAATSSNKRDNSGPVPNSVITFFHPRLFIFLLLTFWSLLLADKIVPVTGAENPKCYPSNIIPNDGSGHSYYGHFESNFNKSDPLKAVKLVGNEDWDVYFSLCGSPHSKAGKNTAIYVEHKKNSSLSFEAGIRGKDLSVIVNDAIILLTYGHAKQCSGDNKEKTHHATVIVRCDPTAKNPVLKLLTSVKDGEVTCLLETSQLENCAKTSPSALPPTKASKSESEPIPVHKDDIPSSGSNSTSFGSIILALIVMGGAYFLCGFLYRRFVVGAQGYEQIPHYLMWKRLGRRIQDKISNLRGGGWASPSDQSYRNYRDRDEDFQYSSPPLNLPDPMDNAPILGPGGNQYQPITQSGPPPKAPSPNLLSGGPPDDADENLLQV